MSIGRMRRQIRDYLDSLGVEIIAVRQNRHAVYRCRRHGREFTITMSLTPKNWGDCLVETRRAIRHALERSEAA